LNIDCAPKLKKYLTGGENITRLSDLENLPHCDSAVTVLKKEKKEKKKKKDFADSAVHSRFALMGNELAKAAENLDVEGVKEILASGKVKDIDARHRSNKSPLMLVCRGGVPHFRLSDHTECESNGRAEIVRLLLEAGANPELAEGSFGLSSVMLATRTGCIPILQVFLDHCKRGGKIFDVCLEQSDFSPLMSAVEVNDLELVKWMLANGADPTTRTPFRKMTALSVATKSDRFSSPKPEIAKVLEKFMEEKEAGGGGGGEPNSGPSPNGPPSPRMNAAPPPYSGSGSGYAPPPGNISYAPPQQAYQPQPVQPQYTGGMGGHQVSVFCLCCVFVLFHFFSSFFFREGGRRRRRRGLCA
jgi:hypothetical protein